ncbi:MAG: peptidoglycan DD-metalloendopeptidase family protein [Cyclobacteriaceae bacterium]
MKYVFGLGLAAVTFFLSCQKPKKKEQPIVVAEIPQPTPTLLYGFPVDSMDVSTGKIKWGQTLSMILENFNISAEQVYNIAIRAKDVYDVRKLKAGKEYTIIHDKDSMHSASKFIFEPDARSYVVYHFGDSSFAEYVERKVEIVEKRIVASIPSGSNVYTAAIEAGGSPELVSKLVDVLAWQVDFFRINSGDNFKVIYLEEQVDGVSVGVKRVDAVFFEHYNKPYYGIYYGDQGKTDYFDEEGNSLRKTFLRAPLDYKRISSRYSPRRFHPVQRRYKAHLGTDYAANPGTPIRTVGDGVVLEAKYSKYNGNYVKIKHNSNYSTQYLHMQKIKTGIRPGVKVQQGQLIGFVGSTGLANGPHLCFRFWKNGRQVDALTVDLPPTEPISTTHLKSFLHKKNLMIHKLDLIKPLNLPATDAIVTTADGSMIGASAH